MFKYTPIYEKFLQPNQRMGLCFKEGWVWLRVLAVERFPFGKPWTLQMKLIGTDGTLDPVELKDEQGNRMFDVTVEHASNIIYHIGIGLKPREMRVYPEYPSGRRRGRVLAFVPTELGTDRSYVTGDDSPYDLPTDALEFVFPYGVTATFGFHNPSDKKMLPAFNVEGAKYRIYIYDPKKEFDRDLIRKMALGTATFYPFTIGPPEDPMYYQLENYWKVKPLTLEKAQTLGVV